MDGASAIEEVDDERVRARETAPSGSRREKGTPRLHLIKVARAAQTTSRRVALPGPVSVTASISIHTHTHTPAYASD